MKKFSVVNYHITNKCNYNCTYCFGKFENKKDPSLEEAKKVIKNIADYFEKNKIVDGRINFAGGEPLLYKYLDELIDYAHSLGVFVSIVTNGSLLSSKRIRFWQGKVSCIGISIDSIDCNTNIKIGRCEKNKSISIDEWEKLAKIIHDCNIDLKINTVVSKFNLNENHLPLYELLKPKKIKLFQMHLIDGINNNAKIYKISQQEFEKFNKNHKKFDSLIVPEASGSMENSYLMINPEGEFQLNNNGVYEMYGDLNKSSLSEIVENVPLNYNKYCSRYIKEGL